MLLTGRLVIVDDHPIVRDGVRTVLEALDDVRVVGEAATVPEAIRVLQHLRPNLVTLDLSLGGGSGLDVLRAIRDELPSTRTLVLTIDESEVSVNRAFALGATGYMSKGLGREHLLESVKALRRGERYVAVRDVARAETRAHQHLANASVRLTPREAEVLALVADGLTSAEIALRLGISRRTVETHRQCVMEKLFARNRAELLMRAMQEGLIRVS